MSFMNHFTLIFTYFTPARSPMFAVAVAGTIALSLASAREIPVTHVMADSVSEFLQGFKSTAAASGDIAGLIENAKLVGPRYGFHPYAVAEGSTAVWAMIILPIFAVLLATVPVSLKINPDPADPPPTRDSATCEKESLWRSHYNLSRAFCLSTPLMFLVLTIIYLPKSGTDTYTFSIYYLLNYLVCVFQIAVFFGFLFAEYKANSPQYNLIQFSLITTCLLVGASFENSEAAEISFLAGRSTAKVQSAKLELDGANEKVRIAGTALSNEAVATPTIDAAKGSNGNSGGTAKPDQLKEAKDRLATAESDRTTAQGKLTEATETAARYYRPNRPAIAMTLLYTLWGLCMVFWVKYLVQMTKITLVVSVSPDPLASSQPGNPKQPYLTTVAEGGNNTNGDRESLPTTYSANGPGEAGFVNAQPVGRQERTPERPGVSPAANILSRT
jgi:hypothetical protein